ncbi:fatty acid hydroxylase [Mycena pura]|uniref:Fatty acid hydroxylase n=1 Tax=Mycena pura TaxID=153505 RepID=A0AAD6YJ95_9AGAR|nr:fatty acid hydroxylase [Mycena pura]
MHLEAAANDAGRHTTDPPGHRKSDDSWRREPPETRGPSQLLKDPLPLASVLSKTMSTPIPQPPTIPFMGNATALDRDVPHHSFTLLAKTYGEIYQLDLVGRKLICVSSYALSNEVSDEKRFQKRVVGALQEVRNLVGDGLFTAQPEEPNWGIAHRLLMPAFGTLAVKGMMEEMRDIANQLLLKWERFGPDAMIDPSEDFTRVALDTIAYCSMSHRLNSFYTEQQPEFTVAMGDFLSESGLRARRPRVLQAVMRGATVKYEADIKLMKKLADRIVATRKAHPIPKHDLLDTMLNSRDPKTGQAMTEQSISENLLTFLIAGHETSSGMMTFMVYYLLKHPEKMRKLRAEIDEVLGERLIQYDDFGKLPYLIAVMRETLRLSSTVPVRAVTSLEDTTIGGGKYAIKKGDTITIQAWQMQRDPAVWGDDAEEFEPERMLDGKFEALPPNAWQPFGFGARACIGRAFAWQEVCLVMGSVIQKFDLSFVDPSYTLQIKQTLTVKPADMRIRAAPRTSGTATAAPFLYATPSSALGPAASREAPSDAVLPVGTGTPLYALYGSNTGTSEAFAQRIANEAPSYGFRPSIGTLDSAAGKVPTDGPVIIVTASFEGEPADNAAHFVDWLRHIEGDTLADVRFAVFGCGNADWTTTYQKIPTLCDDLFAERGAHRLVPRGAGDAGRGGFFESFDEFEAGLWVALQKEYSTSRSESLAQTLEVKTVNAGQERATALRQPNALLGRVIENRVLTKDGPVKRHIEFELPEGATARAGDYVAMQVFENTFASFDKQFTACHKTRFATFIAFWRGSVILSSVGPTSLPVGKPVKLSGILAGYVELSQPATTRDLGILSLATSSDATRSYIEDLKSNYTEAVLERRLSAFEIVESHADIKISIGAFLQMLPSMRVRQYSISSSPLWNPSHVTITISVLDAPTLSGQTSHPFLGVGSTYLASLLPGDRVQMAVRPSAVTFHPPENILTPVVMFCSGSGLAPMRGFIQERAAQKASGREVGSMLLFFGCRSPEKDFLYADTDLAEWTKQGVVDVRPAFSRSPEDSHSCKYVQHRVWADRADVVEAYRKGAMFFTCGSSNVAKGIKDTLLDIIQTEDNTDIIEASKRFERIMKGRRYVTDVFD